MPATLIPLNNDNTAPAVIGADVTLAVGEVASVYLQDAAIGKAATDGTYATSKTAGLQVRVGADYLTHTTLSSAQRFAQLVGPLTFRAVLSTGNGPASVERL